MIFCHVMGAGKTRVNAFVLLQPASYLFFFLIGLISGICRGMRKIRKDGRVLNFGTLW